MGIAEASIRRRPCRFPAGRDVLGRGRTGSGKTVALRAAAGLRLAGLAPGSSRVSAVRTAPPVWCWPPRGSSPPDIDRTVAPLAKAAGLNTTVDLRRRLPEAPGEEHSPTAWTSWWPARHLEDLVQAGLLTLKDVRVTVLDEADHMADMGFLRGHPHPLRAQARSGCCSPPRWTTAWTCAGEEVPQGPVLHSADDAQAAVTTMATRCW
ncbi:hypothetical protein QJS66_18185 [Kocuria rhizophila]|nr:hypothetical protein QJS66_18185 [Kocuria rhizophila]